MIGKFTEWLLENTDLLDEASSLKMSVGNKWNDKSQWPLYTKDEASKHANSKILEYFIKLVNKLGGSEIYGYRFKSEPDNQLKFCEIFINKNPKTCRKERYELAINILNYVDSKPIPIGKDYLYSVDLSNYNSNEIKLDNKKLLDANSKMTLKNSIVVSPTKSNFYVGRYVKNSKNVYELEEVLLFIVNGFSVNEDDKKTCVFKTANAILKGINTWELSKNNCNSFHNSILELFKKINLDENSAEYIVYDKLFSQKITNKKWNPKTELNKIVISNDGKTKYTAIDWMNDSNINVPLSELLIPYLLVNGVETIDNVNVVETLTKGRIPAKNKTKVSIKSISWPTTATNKYVDYNIMFANLDNGEKVPISAKKGLGNTPPLLPMILNNLDNDLWEDKKYSKCNVKKIRDIFNISKNIFDEISNKTAILQWLATYALVGGKKPQNVLKLYKAIMDSDKKYNDKSFKKLLNDNIDMKAFIDKINAASKTNADNNCYPYSLTNIFTHYAADVLKADNLSKDLIYKIEQNKPFYQIVLNDSETNGFTLKIIEPKNIEDDCSNFITFKPKSANGRSKDVSTLSVKDLKNILLTNNAGGGNNQTIGMLLV